MLKVSGNGVVIHPDCLTEQLATEAIAQEWKQHSGHGIGNIFKNIIQPNPGTLIFIRGKSAYVLVEPLEGVSGKRRVHVLVDQRHRNQGHGKKIFHQVAKIILENTEYHTKILELDVKATKKDRERLKNIVESIPGIKCVRPKNLDLWTLTRAPSLEKTPDKTKKQNS